MYARLDAVFIKNGQMPERSKGIDSNQLLVIY